MSTADIVALKQRIERCALAISLSLVKNPHNIAILNGHCKALMDATGEVYSQGAFIRVQ